MLIKFKNLAENCFFYILILLKSVFLITSSQKKIINIPAIRSDSAGFQLTLKLVNTIQEDSINEFLFDFTKCSKLSHNGIVILGGVINYIENQNVLKKEVFKKNISWVGIDFKKNSMSQLLIENLTSYNFFNYFNKNIESISHNNTERYIGYREHTSVLDVNALTEYLEYDWLSNDKLKLSNKLKGQIISKIMEIFMNAYGHGVKGQEHKKLGVYSCSEYDKSERKLHLSVLDFGIGIVKNVMKHSNITDKIKAMEWALTLGNSTNTDSKDPIARGLGLALLVEFVKINKGQLQIFSNDVMAYVNKDGSFTITTNKFPISGTLVSITINCDDRFYAFASEKKPHNFF
ncbi:hypothetical protein MKL42_01375 [Acinetobacter sp. AOR15_HL]|uniref:hypothetical protein n=1 Tax=unclassified Acinetobacter TaxID=196816 RepID=UPI0022EB299A|nr:MULTISPECIES: hypothetical protein [unclassified Acinetobacter]MDA3556170.1 hypothetical protein [Acinetobacter sp. AOR15_HL]MDA3571627.1 hypothetical protein [Acinetobacter sp. AOR14_HL]